VEGSLGLLEHQLVGSSDEDGDSLALSWASGDLDNLLIATGAYLLDKSSGSELIRGELVDMWGWNGVDGLADEVDIISLDILDDHDVFLGQEMESQIVNSVSEDGLLDQKDIAASGNDLLNQSDDVFSLFLQDSVHGGVVIDNDVVLEIGLWGTQAELDETNLGVLDSSWTSGEVRDFVVGEAETIDELTIVNGTTQFHGDLDVSKINVGLVVALKDSEDGVDSHWGEDIGVGGNDLRGKASNTVLDQDISILEVNWGSHTFDDLAGLLESDIESI
jgi:hypothetical protein